MDINKKIETIKNLESLIEEKKHEIEKVKQELEELEKAHQKVKQPELFILLFIIDVSLPASDDEKDKKFEYIYYCPDINEIICRVEDNSDSLLPNAIDLSSDYESIGMPKKMWPGKSIDYWHNIERALNHLKFRILNLPTLEKINSWSELGIHLSSDIIEKGQVRVLVGNHK